MKKPKKTDLPHIIMTLAAWLLFIGCLIRFLAAYGSLDDEIGVHFAGNGSFDVIDKKIFGLYPFVVSSVSLLIGLVLRLLVKKVDVGKNVTEKGDMLMRFALTLYIDFSQLVMVVFFAGVWSGCVIAQHPLDTDIPVACLFAVFGIFPVMVLFLIVTKRLCRVK